MIHDKVNYLSLFGKNMKEYQDKLLNLDENDIIKLQNNESINLTIDNTEYEITSDLVDIRYNSKEGYNIGSDNGNFIILDTRLTKELIEEGNAREFISKVQSLRKEKDFEIENRIIIKFNSNDDIKDSIFNNLEYVKNETLAIDIIFDDSLEKDSTLNDIEIGIDIKVVE